MESIKAIHDAGIQHGDLIDDTFRHILYDTTCEKAFIIDFSTAERHKCPLIMRMRPYTTTPSRATFGCDELWDVATNVSYFGNGPCEYLDRLHNSKALIVVRFRPRCRPTRPASERIRASGAPERACQARASYDTHPSKSRKSR